MKIAFLTAGGIAPCLSASIGALIEEYNNLAPNAELMGYLNGYRGLLLGKSITIPETVKSNAKILYKFGGSPIGNSRVKLTNVDDCVKNGYVKKGEIPLQVAANQLVKDKVNILHTIGGDDTNTMAAELAKYLHDNNYKLTVIGMPKTVDNDVIPITQTLGALTAAEQGAIFFENIVNENTTSTRQLIIHEVMGRHCGWLTAATAVAYQHRLNKRTFLSAIQLSKDRWDIDAVYIPELHIDMKSEMTRLKKLMDEKDCVNIFLSEGAGKDVIVSEMEAKGKKIPKDAFGHVKLDMINPGEWFAKQFSKELESDRTLVQKSGYFARSAAPNSRDLTLIKGSAMLAAECAIAGESGVVGMDLEANDELKLIDFQRIKGGKEFDIQQGWFQTLLKSIGQI